MIQMAKKNILALIILILIIIIFGMNLFNNTVNIYLDGENVSVETQTFEDIDSNSLNKDICSYTLNVMNNTTSDVETLKNGVEKLCYQHGLEDAEINIDSSLGHDQIPIIVHVDGTSMLPTLQNGQTVLVNKTHDFEVGDIVVAESKEYGGIIKRVDKIDENKVHLISDNKNISYEYIDGALYQIKGITTWVDISDVNGVVIDY
ncbi:S24/S26 family peptidase [Methanobrevibacter sp. A27]|uniref:Peptidase S24-like protein n=2 Tax=Methanobrevibacter gottschalkii TaxID=190974 RepID=A0A3N5AZX2_9EURY|nr:S24/S26 family peptidase [Methanobrevibacter sp. A27]RPF50846.1 peptidase S24-like protein [Methanobrevibacter gottschalkii DSM 11977]